MTRLWIFFSLTLVTSVLMDNSEKNDINKISEGSTPHKSIQSDNNSTEIENQLAMQVFAIIEHFKQEDPIGLPLLPLTDPAIIPDVKQSVSMATLFMTNSKLYGISQFRIVEVTTNVKELKATCRIFFDNLSVKGEYSLTSLFSKPKGLSPFTIHLKEVVVDGFAELGVERNGFLETKKIDIDIGFKNMTMDFRNLGLFGSIFQSFANSANNVIFDSIKPRLLEKADGTMKTTINAQLRDFLGDAQIPNSISPVDNAIAEARKQIREKGYDPFQVEDYNYPGVLGLKIYDTWIFGVSSFYRLGEISVNIVKNNAIVTMHVGTQELSGSTKWSVSIAKGMITRSGSLQFTVQYIKVHFVISQPLNLSKRLTIKDLQIDLGNIQIRCSGLGTADYLVEFFVNVFPNILRYQIVDALEKPLLRKIQSFTDRIDVEKLIKDNLEEYQRTGSLNLDIAQHLEL